MQPLLDDAPGRQRRAWGCGFVRAAVMASIAVASALAAAPADAAFPGDNGRIAYVNTIWHGDVGENQIYTIRASGRGMRRLTFRGNNDNPDWAPFGHRIVYLHTPRHGRSGIWVMGANGHHKHPLVPGGRRDRDAAPAWAPGGKRIVFTRSSRRGSEDLMVYSLRTGTTRALHVGRGFSLIPGAPAWSPRGRTIAFSALDKSDPNAFEHWPDLFTVHPDGSHLRQITHTPRWSEDNPDWSPSGQLLVHERAFGGTCEEEIDIVRPDGTDRQRVRAGCTALMPSWASDGRHLLAYAVIGNRSGVWTMTPAGAHRKLIATGGDAHWQPLHH